MSTSSLDAYGRLRVEEKAKERKRCRGVVMAGMSHRGRMPSRAQLRTTEDEGARFPRVLSDGGGEGRYRRGRRWRRVRTRAKSRCGTLSAADFCTPGVRAPRVSGRVRQQAAGTSPEAAQYWMLLAISLSGTKCVFGWLFARSSSSFFRSSWKSATSFFSSGVLKA
jgi:hypothetical protein